MCPMSVETSIPRLTNSPLRPRKSSSGCGSHTRSCSLLFAPVSPIRRAASISWSGVRDESAAPRTVCTCISTIVPVLSLRILAHAKRGNHGVRFRLRQILLTVNRLQPSLLSRRRCERRSPYRRPLSHSLRFFRLPRDPLTARTARDRNRQDIRRKRLPRSEEHTSELQSPDHLVCR